MQPNQQIGRANKWFISLVVGLFVCLKGAVVVANSAALTGEQQLQALLEQAQSYVEQEPAKALALEQKLVNLVSVYGDYQQQFDALFYLAKAAAELEQKEKASDYFERAKRMAMSNQDDQRLAMVQRQQALEAWYASDFAQALYLNQLNESIFRRLGDIESLSKTLNNIGIMYRNLGQHQKALDYYVQSLELKEQLGQKEKIASTLNNIGVLYQHMADYERAIPALQRSIDIYLEVDNEAELAGPYNNLGEVYKLMKQYQQAEKYLKLSFEIEKKFDNVRGIAFSNFTLGELYLNMNRLEQAKQYLTHALELAQQQAIKILIARAANSLAEYYLKQKDDQRAKQLGKYAYEMALETQSLDGQKAVLKFLADIHAETGEFEQAYAYHKLLKKVTDDLTSQANSMEVALMRSQYDWQQKNSEIKLLKSQNEIQALQLEQQKAQRYYYIAGAVFLVLLIILAFMIRNHKYQLIRQQEINNKLSQLDLLKDQMLANTSHELLTPLNGIIGLAQTVQDSLGQPSDADAEIKESIALIIESGYLLSDQVKNILAHAKVHNKQQEFDNEMVNLPVVVSRVVKTLAPLAKPEVTLENLVDDSLGDIRSDKTAVVQILNNLIGNALKFTDQGFIRVSGQVLNNVVEISVSDSGIGIPPDKIETIFESYQQANGEYNRLHGGVGLGLSISRDLATGLGGTITVTSTQNVGSTFCLRLPRSGDV